MKKAHVLLVVLGLALASASPVHAAKVSKSEKAGKRAANRTFSRFDANGDGSLDSAEAQRVRRVYNTIKDLDTDKNGELSDSEIAAAKIEKNAKRKGKGAKRTR